MNICAHPVRVLLVDDSAFLRYTLTRRLEATGHVQIVGTAVDGVETLNLIKHTRPEVIVLDVEMPRLGGLATLQHIMAETPVPVVMLSGHTQQGASTTIQALLLGAVDFVAKPVAGTDIGSVMGELVDKIQLAACTAASRQAAGDGAGTPGAPAGSEMPVRHLQPRPLRQDGPVIVVGVSTGGPRALKRLLAGLPGNLPAAMVIVQHMPLGFTASLAQRLNDISPITVQEASPGQSLARGLALVARGDYHLRVGAAGRAMLEQTARRNHLRPSLDITFESAAKHYGPGVIGVVLTGMGSDGTEGARHIRAAGGQIVAEHASTCAVYGMPRSVIDAGLADEVLPLGQIAARLVQMVS